MIKSRILRGTILGGLIVIVAACGKKAPPPAEAPTISVVTASVEAGSLIVTYKVSATLEAWDKADVSAEIPGIVRVLPVNEGDEIRAGNVLARLDAAVLSANVSEVSSRLSDARIALADAQSDLDRVVKLRENGVATQSELDKARVRVERSAEGIAALRGSSGAVSAQLAKTTLTSPISGVVTRREIELGEMVSPGRMIFRIENLFVIRAVMLIPAREIKGMSPGDSVIIALDDGDSLIGVISYVSAAADPIARTVKVEARFDNPDQKLRTGIFAEAMIVRSEIPRAVLVPKSALIRHDDGAGAVFVVADGIARKREVRLGASSESFFEVVSGLRVGENIVPADLASLVDGVKVNPITKSADVPAPMTESSRSSPETGGR